VQVLQDLVKRQNVKHPASSLQNNPQDRGDMKVHSSQASEQNKSSGQLPWAWWVNNDDDNEDGTWMMVNGPLCLAHCMCFANLH
jgi:hypothetical protein